MERIRAARNVKLCPFCGSDRFAVRVVAWANYREGRPHCFDPDDISYVEPIPGAEVVCQCCLHSTVIFE